MCSTVLSQSALGGEELSTLGALKFVISIRSGGVVMVTVSVQLTRRDKLFVAKSADLVGAFGLDELLGCRQRRDNVVDFNRRLISWPFDG